MGGPCVFVGIMVGDDGIGDVARKQSQSRSMTAQVFQTDLNGVTCVGTGEIPARNVCVYANWVKLCAIDDTARDGSILQALQPKPAFAAGLCLFSHDGARAAPNPLSQPISKHGVPLPRKVSST